jgi:photosystem II stability/assembly factor-like uncharacterized protein
MCALSLSAKDMSWAQTWVDMNPFNQPPGNTLHSVSSVDEECGWVVGVKGFISHTTDGGLTWQEQGDGATEKDLVGIVNIILG